MTQFGDEHRLIRFVLLTIALSVSLHSQGTAESTEQMANGRLWTTMDEASKISYLTGLRDDAIFNRHQVNHGHRDASKRWTERFVVSEYIKELNDLYSVPANLALPIPAALTYCRQKLRGKTTHSELEQTLLYLRKLYS